MNPELKSQHYIKIPHFITPERAAKLTAKLRNLSAKDGMTPNKVANSIGVYNFMPCLELLIEKIPQVTKTIEAPILPTYCYSRIYEHGAELKKHRDRAACEISLTLNVDGDREWPIWFQTASGENHSVLLQPGDAAIYLGCDAFHWREQYTGTDYIQIFMHYVRSRGPNAKAYFDRIKTRERRLGLNVQN